MDTLLLTVAFLNGLRQAMTREQLLEVQARTRTEQDKSICHSHDFCDANVVMMEAFEKVFYRAPEADDFDQIDRAWDLMKEFLKVDFA